MSTRIPTPYEDLLRKIRDGGALKTDRTGTGTVSLFGEQIRYDLQSGFPLITTKKIFTRAVVYELLWFLLGRTDVKWLQDRNVTIWDEWADENGDLGPIYGKQWRSWEASDGRKIDQIANIIKILRTQPDSRRMVVSAWNVGDLEKMSLMACHALFQFYVADGKLSCQLYQRSADMFLGVPFNIASYALLTHMIAQQVGLDVGEFIWTGGDCHIYVNHFDQVDEQLGREPYPYPRLELNPKPLDAYEYEDIRFIGYQSHPKITAPVAV